LLAVYCGALQPGLAFFLWAVPWADAGAATVLVNKLHPRGFQRAADCEVIGGCKRNPLLCNLSTADCIHVSLRPEKTDVLL
jgi:hypothetical protein